MVSGEAVDAAFAAAGYNDQTKGDSLNEWAWLGNTTLTAAQTTAFVNALKNLAVTDITPTASNGGKTQTFTFAEGGLSTRVESWSSKIMTLTSSCGMAMLRFSLALLSRAPRRP